MKIRVAAPRCSAHLCRMRSISRTVWGARDGGGKRRGAGLGGGVCVGVPDSSQKSAVSDCENT